jgi:hypothetical protein
MVPISFSTDCPVGFRVFKRMGLSVAHYPTAWGIGITQSATPTRVKSKPDLLGQASVMFDYLCGFFLIFKH